VPLHVPTDAEVRALLDGLVLPPDFLIGSATAGYQVEGGYNLGDGPRNNWAEWESRPGNERTGPGAGHWADPERDFRLARAMHLNAHRLGVEWARVQPVHERRLLDRPPKWDEAVLDRYVDLLVSSRAHGLEPIVTLHHFTHPYWAGQDLWLSDEGVDLFVRYAGAVAASLNERLLDRDHAPIRHWITCNEPYVLAVGTYLARFMPAGTSLDLGSPARVLRALDGLYAAHVRVYGEIHRWYETRGLERPVVTFNNFALDFYGGDRFFVDLVLSRSRDVAWGPALKRDLVERQRSFHAHVEPLIARARALAPERWFAARGMRTLGQRIFSPDRFPRLGEALWACDWDRPLDTIAFDYYDATLANQLRLAAGAYEPWDWEVIPEGLYDLLVANGHDGLPVLVAENGMATRGPVGERALPRSDGVRRDEFLRAHLFHLLRAVKAGIPVSGYLHWSLTDNYEWGRFAPRFGLHGVDYADEARPRLATDASGVDAAATYGALAAAIRTGDTDALADALLGRAVAAGQASAGAPRPS
jgi:beta-glucosidase/6-phospho-beta-glucosidase/beta-galactosidase